MVASSSVSDTDPGSSAFLTPGSGKQDGKEKIFKVKILKFFQLCRFRSGSGMGKNLDPYR